MYNFEMSKEALDYACDVVFEAIERLHHDEIDPFITCFALARHGILKYGDDFLHGNRIEITIAEINEVEKEIRELAEKQLKLQEHFPDLGKEI